MPEPIRNDDLVKFLNADPAQQEAILKILAGIKLLPASESSGPLLMGMGAGARFLGVSRPTLWRMIRRGIFEKVEVLPGSYRLRRADLEAFVNSPRTNVRAT